MSEVMRKLFNLQNSIWLKLSTPSTRISDPIEREKARLMLVLLTSVLPIGIVVSLLFPFTTGNRSFDADRNSLFVYYSLAGWIIIYFLARSRYHKISIWLSLATATAIILFSAVPYNDYEDFFYLVFVIMVSGLFFSLREIIYVYFLCLLGASSMLFIYPESIWEGFFYLASVLTLGGLVSLIGSQYLRNISAMHYKQELLREAQYRMLLENAYDGLAEIQGGKFVKVDSSFALLFGIPPEEFIGKPVTDILFQQRAKDSENRIFETIGHTAAEEILHLEVLHSPFPTSNSYNQVIAIRNITERKVAEAELKKQALYDPVTGLFNRTQLLKHVTQRQLASPKGMKTSLMFLDLDDFKAVNDQFGHEAGDELLKKVGKRLGDIIREGDIIARYGGDEFILVCDYPMDDTYTIAQRVLSSFNAPFLLKDGPVYITTSIGIVRNIIEHANVDAILRAADKAMYRAKERGKNQYEYAYPEKVV